MTETKLIDKIRKYFKFRKTLIKVKGEPFDSKVVLERNKAGAEEIEKQRSHFDKEQISAQDICNELDNLLDEIKVSRKPKPLSKEEAEKKRKLELEWAMKEMLGLNRRRIRGDKNY
jgi:hypothetical protein